MNEWGAVLVALVGAVGLFLQQAASASKTRAEARQIRESIEKVRYQISNGHESHLREDIDNIAKAVLETGKVVSDLAGKLYELEKKVRML